MEQMKKHKLHILLPVILVVLSLICSLLSSVRGTSTSASSHVSLGQQYLNNLDYSAAILEFSNAISVDPTNKDARIGLAQAYSESGNHQFAIDVLEDILDENALDPDLTQQLIQIYEAKGEDAAVLRLIDCLIKQTDEDTYYEQKIEILARLCNAPHTYAVGTDQVLLLSSAGGVQSRGSNTLGQLGTAQSLGVCNAEQADFVDAGFPGTAHSVYCAGRTSYVIDENGDLWAAGENRWGQMGLSYGTALPESGWVRLIDTGDAAAVSGGSGELLLLRSDGTLWRCGGKYGQTLTRCTQLGTVIRICTSQGYHYALTSGGKLYRQDAYSDGTWEFIASNVADFTACGYQVWWRTTKGNLGSNYSLSYPSNWEWTEDGTVCADIDFRALASNGSYLFLQSEDGELYQLDNRGTLIEVQLDSPVTVLFSEAGCAVAVLEDGKTLSWVHGDGMYSEIK